MSSSRRDGGCGLALPLGSALGGGAAMASRKAETLDIMSTVTSLKVRRWRISMASVVAVDVQ